MSSAVAVAVNLATEWKHNVWAWLAVLVLTVGSGGVALWLEQLRTGATFGFPHGGGPVVNDAVICGDNVQIGQAGRDVNIDRVR